MNDEMVAAVHQYSNHGWVVHPLAPPTDPGNSPGKRPLLPGWQKLTKTPENIETYIKEGCNLGLVCGNASGVTVFDIDSEIFIDDLFEGVKINKTLRSRRTSGRGHIYFKYNPNLKSQKHHALEIEILSDGSNAVLPPSVHRSGERYEWNDESAPLLEIPAKLIENWTRLCDQEKRLNSLISKCRPCFKSYWKNEKKVVHGPNARLFLGAFCSELSNKGADLDLIKLFAKIIYRNDYDENQTITEFNGWTQKGYKPWTCEKLKEQCVGFTECDNCPIKTRKGEKGFPLTKLDGAISTFKQPDMLELAEGMQRSFPIYFDRARIYWMWVHERRFFTMVDETDILSVIRRALEIPHLAGSSVKNEILEAIRVTGRERDVKLTEQTWVHLANGVYDLKTKTLFEATPEHLFTTPIPHKMSTSTDKLTTIDRLFAEWVGPDKKILLYEICAYCLYDGYPIHRLFCCVGKGRNGKGQFLTLLERLLGEGNTTSTTLERLMQSRFESAKLFKKKAAFIGETNFSVLKDTGIIKLLTGGDKISCEFKNKSPFDFHNTAKIIISTNSLPTTLDKTDGFYSRWVIVDFPNQFDEGKNVIDSIPEQEYDDLIARCLEILPGLLERGKFTNEGSITDRARVYEARSNPIGQFIELYCIRKPDEIAPYWKVFEEFERFESEKGYRRISKKEFTAILENEGFTTDKKKWGDNTWVTIFGLKLKNYSFDEKGTVTDSTLVQENQLPESDGLPMPKVTDVTDVTDSSLRSIYEEQSITPVTSVTSVTELIARAGREWEQLKCKNIDGSVLAEFCLWFCEQKDKNKTPSEIRSIAEKIFSITPTKTNVCIVCQDALNGDPETTAFGDVHRSCKWSPLKIKILKDIPASGYNYGDIHLNRIEEFKAGTYADLPGIVALNLISRQMAQRVKSEYAVPIQDLHKKAADITNKSKKRPDDLDFARDVLIAALKDTDPSYEKSTLAWVANTALMDRGWNAENHESSIKGGV